MKKVNININETKFKLLIHKVKSIYSLDTPTSGKVVTFNNIKDVVKYLDSYYPVFVVNKFKKILKKNGSY